MSEESFSKENMKIPEASSKGVWVKRFGKALDIGGEAADILVHVKDITPIAVASLGLRVVNSIRSRIVQTPTDYFLGKEWFLLDTFGFNEYLYKACLSTCKSRCVDGLDDEHEQAVITEIEGISYGWIIRDGKLAEGPFALEGTDRKRAQQVLGRMIWEHVGSNSCVLCSDQSKKAVFQAEEEIELLESKLTLQMLGRVKTFAEKGLNRSVLLLGEPGTGKSCMMRYMANKIGGFSLRISINDLEDVNRRDLMSSLFLLSPDVILVDDFDRLSNAEGFLADLEEINRRVKLFMVSCNSVNAVIRPGRFDEMHIIDRLDPDIVTHLVGDIDKETGDILKQLPIAYVVEFAKRIDALGMDEAKVELRELAGRARKLYLLRKNEGGPRKIRYKRTPAQIAKRRRKRATDLAKSIEAEKEYIEAAKKSVIPDLKVKLQAAEARADEAEKRAILAKEEQKRKSAKKAARTRKKKQGLEKRAKEPRPVEKKAPGPELAGINGKLRPADLVAVIDISEAHDWNNNKGVKEYD